VSNRKWHNESIDHKLADRNIVRVTDVSNIRSPSNTKIQWMCEVCNGVWSTTVDSVINLNSGCPHCAGNTKLTVVECQYRLSELDVSVISLDDCGTFNHERKGQFVCNKCDNIWETTLSNIFSNNQGCPKCGKSGRYTSSWFESNDGSIPGILYLIKLSNDNEVFIKVGITKHTLTHRIASIPYQVDVLYKYRTTLHNAFNLEQSIKHQFNAYNPTIKFGGWTECFHKDTSQQIINFIKGHLPCIY